MKSWKVVTSNGISTNGINEEGRAEEIVDNFFHNTVEDMPSATIYQFTNGVISRMTTFVRR